MADVLFITTKTLKKHTIIDGSVDPDLLVQHIYNSQTIRIQEKIGTKLYERLLAGTDASNLTANEILLIDTYIVPALIHWAASEYFTFARYTASNGGLFIHQPDNAVIVSKEDTDALSAMETKLAEYYSQQLINYLKFNDGLYPEYLSNVDDDIQAENEQWHVGGWYMKR